ncbi:MAG: hypothetical protein H7Z14_08500 [Anaerolineae bacterium]|nr:hypothetical protein [Phycisphaerae bacterium]
MSNSSSRRKRNVSPALAAIAGWLLPGAGYFLIGDFARGVIVGATIIAMFLGGILLAGIRVVDVPGYDKAGQRVKIDAFGRRIESTSNNRQYDLAPWSLTGRGFFAEMVNKPWYVCQILSGPICLIASGASLSAASNGVPTSHARLYEIGTLYTAVAGLLNLLAVIDAAHRAARAQEGR